MIMTLCIVAHHFGEKKGLINLVRADKRMVFGDVESQSSTPAWNHSACVCTHYSIQTSVHRLRSWPDLLGNVDVGQ